MQRAKESPTPDELGGSTGNRAGECNPHHLMGDAAVRLARYGNAKFHTLAALDAMGDSAAIEAGMRVGKIRACGDWLKFRHFPSLNATHLHSANFCCVHLACGFCAIRRGARMMARYLERFQSIRAKRPHLSPYLVTFTVLNGADLRERLLHLERSLTRLHKRRHGKRSRSLLTMVQGAVWSYEVTWSQANGWHPHVHAIWLASEEPDQNALRDEWKSITGDSFICDVRPIAADENAPADCDPHAKGFAEVFKYALKAAELPAKQMLEAFTVLKGRRLVRSFGEFFGVKEPDSGNLGDELPAADLPYIELLWRYAGGARYEFAKATEVDFAGVGRGDAPDVSAGCAVGEVPVAAVDLRRAARRAQQRERNVCRQMVSEPALGSS